MLATKAVFRFSLGGFLLLGLLVFWAALMSPARPEIAHITFGQKLDVPESVELNVPDTVEHEKGERKKASGTIEGASIVITWKATSVGCNYHISLRKSGSARMGFDNRTHQKCHPRDLLNFLQSLQKSVENHLDGRGVKVYEALVEWLNNILFPPF